jgi:uncharacterized membrane protein YvlD (DUF360 family)
MDALREAARFVYRLAVLWIVDVISLLVTAAILPGFALESVEGRSVLVVAVAGAFLLGLVNLLIRPVILLLALPLGLIAVSLVGFVVNTIALRITAELLPGFLIDSWWVAFVAGLILALINTIITNFLTIDDEGSFYEALVERLAKRQAFDVEQEPGRGVVMMEIDGLSYHHLEKALEKGLMPTVSQMMDEEGYVLSRVDCGLPSQTSACQSGIMFGDNYDIPAFRWYDKDRGKLMVSGSDAPLINARYAMGHGLLRGGSSINNMMNGDAAKSLLTLADFQTEDEEQKRRRAEDIYLLMLNPYFFVRTLVLFFGDALLELWQGFKQRLRDEQPRLNRLHRAYPLLRAATTVVMRDIATYLTSLDIIRGTPALYVTWPGYDEVAHHSGPWSRDAFGVLKRYDQVIARIRDVMTRKAPRQYELILLSDHGQSFGATFKQRYGYDLQEFIEGQLPYGARVAQSVGGDDGTIAVVAMAGELENVQDQQVSGNLGRAVAGRAQRLLQQGAERRAPAEIDPEATVTVCGSGNLAQVYFDLYPRKITLNELNAAYPGLVDALVGHEGVGFVVAYADDGTPMVFGKKGARDLHSGQITGEDPLAPFGEVTLRARQVRRIADFPHAGDLIVNSTLYPDGTVAAMEELIGNHGGLGGEQTDAFLFHPGDMTVPETANSADLFAILDARRDLPAADGELGTAEKDGEVVHAWAPGTLGQGLRQGRVWLVRALRALVLSRSAYREAVSDPYMTGPALLITILAALLAASFSSQTPLEAVGVWAVRLLGWLLGVLVVFGAGRLLGGRGSFTATLRGVGFAQVVYLLELLALIPALSSLVQLITSILGFVATWMAGLEAQELRGWRGLLLPVAWLLVVVLSVVILGNLIAGAEFTIEALLREAGLLTPGP